MISNMSIEIREGPDWGENTIKFKYEHVIALLKTFLWPLIASGIKIKISSLPFGSCGRTSVDFGNLIFISLPVTLTLQAS